MIIANRLKETNRAEFLLYMWQVEDLLRSFQCDSERIREEYLVRFKLPEHEYEAICRWYEELCDMMRSEGVLGSGHLQICRNILFSLEELHVRLMNCSRFPTYHTLYAKVLPFIVELRAKNNIRNKSELEVCFEALYGILILRLKNEKIAPETLQAKEHISSLLGKLSEYYFIDNKEPIDFD